MPYLNVTPGVPAPYKDGGGLYMLNGGTITVDTDQGLLGLRDTTSTNYGHVASVAGNIYVHFDERAFYANPVNKIFKLEIENTKPVANVTINYLLSGTEKSVTALWNGTKTIITFILGDGQGHSVTLNIGIRFNSLGLPAGKTVSFPTDNNSGLIKIVCYARGTRIETPTGERLIEDLRAGDEVITYKDQGRTAATITWVGTRRVIATDEAEKLVRVRKDALQSGVPNRDLLITPEHCLFIDGRLFPVRTLVNGRSIAISNETEFEVFHLELEEHSIIFANGASSESFLDTGNKHLMLGENARSLTLGNSDTACRISAAPICIAPEQIKPVHDALAMRAAMQDYAPATIQPTITPNPDLHLALDNHRKIRPARIKDGQYIFFVPHDVERFWIVSNIFIPSQSYGPWYDDRRELGVLVGKISLYSSTGQINYTEHLKNQEIDGWHAIETKTHRWTNGHARLDIGPDFPDERIMDAVMVISIEVIATGTYFTLPAHPEHSLPRFSRPQDLLTRENPSAAIASLVDLVINHDHQIRSTAIHDSI
ncbi:Hint domain-containing protein [Asaia prunellae]|uniref:Hint domain-containing protein n=1 Tax=Asaia prunellae TaxID=610245 RepID=UPI00046F1764|nr:Hint domain-containing protein [Asaia prunellae]